MPCFSVIVPVYKSEKYLPQCLNSILTQDFSDFEVVLVDDGSPDNSGLLCDSFAALDNRVKVIHKENGGATSARLAGANAALSDYILPIDSDDYIFPGLFKKIGDVISKHSPDIICYNYQCEGGQIVSQRNGFENKLFSSNEWQEMKARLVYDPQVSGFNWGITTNSLCTKAFKKDLYIKHQLDVPKEIIQGEDLAVSAPALLESRSIYFLDFLGYFYRSNDASQMNTFRADDAKGYMILREYLLANLCEENVNSVNVFTLGSIADYALKAARYFKTDNEFLCCMNENITDDMLAALKTAKIGRFTIKERIKVFLVKHKMFKLFYMILK